MRQRHEISAAWRGAPWGKRRIEDWAETPATGLAAPRVWLPLGLSVALGLALGATVVAGLARQDQARFDMVMAAAHVGE